MGSMSIEAALLRAPAIGNREAHPWMSKRFAPIATVDLLEPLVKEGYEIASVQQTVGKVGDYGLHIVRLRAPGHAPTVVGQAIPELVLSNAADGSRAFRFSLGLYRMICCNGLMAGTTFQSFDIDHKADAPERALIAAEAASAELVKLVDWASRMSEKRTTEAWRTEYARRAAAIRWAGPNGTTDPVGVEDFSRVLSARRDEDRGDDVWTVYNVAQENLIRGGTVTTLGATGRRTLSRGLTSTQAQFDINSKLFDLTNRMAA